MGATYVDVTVRNPADLDRSWTGSFLVDLGAYDSMAPRSVLEAIGIERMSSREYGLADGSVAAYDVGTAVLEFEGVLIGNTVIFGEEGAEPLLSVTALESGGFDVDPRREELRRLPTARLYRRKLIGTRSGSGH